MSKEYIGIQFLNEASVDTAELIIEGEIGYESWWYDEPDQNTLKAIRDELNRIKDLKAKNIIVKIHSLGGSVDHALAIYDLLEDHNAIITTQVNGMCASAATIIAMAGKSRRGSYNSLELIHKCISRIRGNENDLKAELEAQKTVNQRILNIYKAKCPEEKHQELEELFDANNGNGKWITAEEAKSFGFITEIYNEPTKAATFDKKFFNKYHYPEIPPGYEALICEEKDESSLIDKIVKKVTAIITPNNNHKSENMKKFKDLFPLLFVAMAFNDEQTFDEDKGMTFTNQQLRTIEDRFKVLNEENSKIKGEREKAESERDQLQNKLDNIPNPQNEAPPAGEDQKSGDPSFEAQMKINPKYKAIADEIGGDL